MREFNITAIVVRRSHYGETDNILTLYSREKGLISAIAKGARKPVSRLSGSSEVLCCSRFGLSFGRNLQIVRQAEIVESFSPLREDLVRLANGLYLADLLSAFISDADPNSDLFDLLETSLRLLVASKAPEIAARWFEMRLLDHAGYLPLLTECVYCGASIARPIGMFALSAAQGGALCSRHSNVESFDDQSHLDGASLLLLQALSTAQSAEGLLESGLLESPHRGSLLASSALRRYINYRIDRKLKSLEFLDTVQSPV